MAGVWCPRCQSRVILEQDGRSCSNCGRTLVIAAPEPPHVKAAKKAAAKREGRRASHVGGKVTE